MARRNELHITDRAAWRAWLKKHGTQTQGVWLVFDKKHTGRPALDYGAAVEEALCFGWIDSILRRIDDKRYARKFTPRKDSSRWSELNKKRAAKMIKQGLMTEDGLTKVEAAKARGAWAAATGSSSSSRGVALEMPEEFAAVLSKNKKAARFFEDLAPSHQKHYLGWIGSAKKPETRARRASEAVTRLAVGRTLGLK